MKGEILYSDNLQQLSNVRHGFFTRGYGVERSNCSSFYCRLLFLFNRKEVTERLDKIAAAVGVTAENLLTCNQTHSSICKIVVEPWSAESRPSADAMVTTKQGTALGILTADCVPVLLADAKAGVIGAIHAGWRGALNGIIENTVKAMEGLGALRHDIKAALGPCIWQENYEVGQEFLSLFLKESLENARFFKPSSRSGHHLFDLPGYVCAKLMGLGVNDISPSVADTFSDESRFFSYRRDCLRGERTAGRLISAISLIT